MTEDEAEQASAQAQAEGLIETARLAAAGLVAETEALRAKAAVIVIETAEVKAANLVIQTVIPRVDRLQFRLNVLAAFVLVGLIVVTALLQRQATSFEAELQATCVARQAANDQRNHAWSTLAHQQTDAAVAQIYLAAVMPLQPC